jgi:2,3-dihydroxybenzoate-AMP ligase
MSIAFTRWPAELEARYRARGYWIDRPLSALLETQAAQRPDAIALICGERQWSYAELDARATRLAAALQALGLARHDTALVQLPNVAEFYVVFFALMKLGVMPVNALYSHQRLELTAYAQQVRPALVIGCAEHALFHDARFVDALTAMLSQRPHVLVHGADAASLDAAIAFEAAPLHSSPTAPDEVAFFQLSGGSTGTPKLIPRTHNDYDYSVRASVDICGLSARTRFLCALPAAHNFAMSSPGALGVFHAGGTLVLARHPEPQQCFDLIERHAVTMTALVPPAVALWLDAAPSARNRLRSLQWLQVGGANFGETLARRVPTELGCRLQQVFGMAEGLVNYTRLDDDDERVFTTQGRPISPDDEIRVVDEDGIDVATGDTGLLLTRGPYTLRGYYASPDYNARAFDADGWYRSGDLVCRDADGYLRVVGRVKDQVNRGGEKIAAEEIEDLLRRHEAVLDAAIVAMPDALLGEKTCAFIVSRSADLRAIAVRKHLRELGVAEFKLPDRVEFVTDLPLTAVGKIDKQRLRSQFPSISI